MYYNSLLHINFIVGYVNNEHDTIFVPKNKIYIPMIVNRGSLQHTDKLAQLYNRCRVYLVIEYQQFYTHFTVHFLQKNYQKYVGQSKLSRHCYRMTGYSKQLLPTDYFNRSSPKLMGTVHNTRLPHFARNIYNTTRWPSSRLLINEVGHHLQSSQMSMFTKQCYHSINAK